MSASRLALCQSISISKSISQSTRSATQKLAAARWPQVRHVDCSYVRRPTNIALETNEERKNIGQSSTYRIVRNEQHAANHGKRDGIGATMDSSRPTDRISYR